MKAVTGFGTGLLSGLFVLTAAGAASAQVQPGGAPPRAQSAPFQSAVPQYSGRHRPGTPTTPPTRTIELPPESLGPGSLGLLEREFQYMRRTAPQPDKFMGGRWNPRYQTITPAVPPSGFYPGGGYYGGGYYGGPYYGGGFYGGGLYNPYGAIGYGYSPYRVPPAVVQQEVVVIQDRAQELQKSGGLRPDPRSPAPRQPQQQPSGKPSLDGFYLGDKGKSETISDALDDIRKAWLNGDVERLNQRFKKDGKVKVFPKGEYKYTVDAKEFTAMLADAMKKIDTVSFELERPKSDESGVVLVTGTHTFVDEDKEKRTTYISYGLQKIDGRWMIVEAGSSSAPIAKHSQQ